MKETCSASLPATTNYPACPERVSIAWVYLARRSLKLGLDIHSMSPFLTCQICHATSIKELSPGYVHRVWWPIDHHGEMQHLPQYAGLGGRPKGVQIAAPRLLSPKLIGASYCRRTKRSFVRGHSISPSAFLSRIASHEIIRDQ